MNTGEENSYCTRTRRAGRPHTFDSFGSNHVLEDPRNSSSVPPSTNTYHDLPWHPPQLQPQPQRYNARPVLQEYQAQYDDGSFQLGYQDQAPLTRTPAYPGRQRFTTSHSSTTVGSVRGSVAAPPQLSIAVPMISSDDTQETGPPILGIDISVAEVENILRETYNISSTVPVHIDSIPDPHPAVFTYAALTQIAIWSSRDKRLTLADIYDCLGKRFKHLRNPDTTTKWKGNIRHLLSLKKCFVKSTTKQAGRHYWTLDYRYLKGGDKRERKRGRRTRDGDPVESEDVDEQLDEDLASKDDSSSSSSPDPSSTSYFSNRYFTPTSTSTFIARSPSDLRAMNSTYSEGSNYPLQTRSTPGLPRSYSSYPDVTGERRTFSSPGSVSESYDPRSVHQHQPYPRSQLGRPHTDLPASAATSTPSRALNAFGENHFSTGSEPYRHSIGNHGGSFAHGFNVGGQNSG